MAVVGRAGSTMAFLKYSISFSSRSPRPFFDEVGYGFVRRVSPCAAAKASLILDISELGELLSEFAIVFLLFGVEPEIFKQGYSPSFRPAKHFRRTGAYRFVNEQHFHAEQ